LDFTAFFSRYGRSAFYSFLALAALAGSYFRSLELYELQTYDWRCQVRGQRPVSDDIVLIDIWDDTLEAIGAWPFDRSYHSDMIKILKASGVRAVAMDMLFVEPRDGDTAVAQAAKEANNVYFVTALYNVRPKGGGKFSAERVLAPALPAYVEAARGVAHVNSTADRDGKRRRTYPVITESGKDYYQLSFRIAMDLLDVRPDEVRVAPGREILLGDRVRVPIDDEGCYIVSYAGRWEKTFAHYSYYDVLASYVQKLSGEKPILDLSTLRGKICFIGLTSLGSHDTNPIPIQSVYPMVGMHANVLNNLLLGDHIRRLGRLGNLLLAILLSGWVVWLSVHFKPLRALLVFLATLAAFIAAGIGVFVIWGIWADLFYPSALLVLIYAGTTLRRMMSEMRKRELIENELKIASQIQKSFLPETLPTQAGLEVAVFMKPAKAVGGDLYAFLPLGGERLGVMVGDVSGKGTPAALFMAKTVSEFKFSARGGHEAEQPASVLGRLNDSIASESTGGLFVTLMYTIFDMARKKLVLSNGGHLPVVAVRSASGAELISADDGMPIGVLPGATFADHEIDLGAGDCFALYSDGVSEARNRRKEEFGMEALERAITERRQGSAKEILDHTVEELQKFMGRADQHDDITLIVIKVQP